jgi:GNAT superfamily N-acetyltransferase
MVQVRLRPAALRNASELAQIHVRARTAAMPWLPTLHSTEETATWMANVVLPRQDVWIALRDGAVVGFVALMPGWIEQLYVDPIAWRSGIGSALIDHAKQHHPEGFRLWTFQRNAMARSFYRKHGLIEIRSTDGYDNEEKEPDVLLGWKFTS